MKKMLMTIMTAACLALPCLAQTTNSAGQTVNTNTPQASMQSFMTTAEQYVTSFNTNLPTFWAASSNNYQLWTGISYQSGVNLGITLGVEAQPFSGSLHGLTLGSVSTLASQVGTIAQQEADLGWSIVHYDVRITAGGAFIYTFQNGSLGEKGAGGGFYLQLEKALTQNTFAGLRVMEKFGQGQSASKPFLGIFAGAVF
jgi:hypothetical protein